MTDEQERGPHDGGEDEGVAYDALKGKISAERGFNCRYYKTKCLRRRIAVRMRARGCASYGLYARLLDEDPHEYDLLLDTLTINVSKFFRNLETWEVLEARIVPDLFDRCSGRCNVWSAGSAAGEEAYSVAIALHEHMEREADARSRDTRRRFRIVGTDIDRHSLMAAERAEYPELAMAETSEERRERWFSPGPPYRLMEEVRRGVSFHRRDLISDEHLRGQHLILCRNVIIYFGREIQETLFSRFYDALVPGGYLVLGKVETLLGPARARFKAVSNRERIFQKPR